MDPGMNYVYYLFRSGRDVIGYLTAPEWTQNIIKACIWQEMEDKQNG